MEVTLGKEGLKKTWQEEFPQKIKCCKCKRDARIGFVAHEGLSEKLPNQPDEKYICSLHPNEGKGDYWLHDCCAVAVYFCKECLEVTAIYNQS